MEVEVLSDAAGTIVALAARRVIAATALTGASKPSHDDAPLVRMVAPPGHTRHVVALDAGLTALPLREIAQRFRIVHDGSAPRFAERDRA